MGYTANLQTRYFSHTTPTKESEKIQNTHYRDKLMLKSLPPTVGTERAVKVVT